MSNGRVTQGGGLFHPAKVKYSPETQKFLKDLMAENRLSMMQRQKVNYSLRTGNPLPVLNTPAQTARSAKQEVSIRPGSSKRRSYSSIVESGAYSRDRFVPLHPKVDRDAAKQHLQDHMAYGKELKNIYRPKPKENKTEKANRFDELKNEIQERVDWLAEMEKLGEAYKHKIVIEQQIAARVREMKTLKSGGDKIQYSK